jgi:hypothetical protein
MIHPPAQLELAASACLLTFSMLQVRIVRERGTGQVLCQRLCHAHGVLTHSLLQY